MSFMEIFDKYSSKYFNVILTFSFVLAFSVACAPQKSVFPNELSLSKRDYSKEESYLFGPGGINQSLQIFKLKGDVAQKINEQGLSFLNSMPSTIGPHGVAKPRSTVPEPYGAPFKTWKALPVVRDAAWIRRSYIVGSGDYPTVSEFFADVSDSDSEGFTGTIDPEKLRLLNDAIRGGKGYYSYGGYRDMCILIVSPEQNLAFYLFRD